MVSQSIFSPMASFVLKAKPNQAAFFVLGLPSQGHFFSGPFLRISSYQLNPADFAILI